MPRNTYSGPLGPRRRAHGTTGGDTVTITPALILLPRGTRYVFVTPHTFSSATVVGVGLNPYLSVVKTQDALGTSTDYTDAAQDGDTATKVTLNSQDTGANGDYLYVGAHVPFRGVKIDVNNVNGNASVLTVEYWNGAAWADISATDGTASAGAAFAADGDVSWTVPAAWAPTTLSKAVASVGPTVHHAGDNYFWVRFKVSAALDSTTDFNSMLALHVTTSYAEYLSGYTLEEEVTRGPGGFACVEHACDASTAKILVNVAAASATSRFQ